MCLSLTVHPSMRKNSSKSSTRFLQHVQLLFPSWNSGWPGWCTHRSPSRPLSGSYACPHPRRRQVLPRAISRAGSSESDSGGGGAAAAGLRTAAADGGFATRGAAGRRVGGSAAAGLGFSGGLGVSSIAECLPVVQGGMERNSSNVRTRGLQHCQPVPSQFAYQGVCRLKTLAFLALVEDRRAGMVDAWRHIFVSEDFPTALVHALQRHSRDFTVQEVLLEPAESGCVGDAILKGHVSLPRV